MLPQTNLLSSQLLLGTPPSDEVPAGPYPTIVPGVSGDVLVVQEYTFGKYLGYLEVTFDDDGNVMEYSGNPILLNETYSEGECSFSLYFYCYCCGVHSKI